MNAIFSWLPWWKRSVVVFFNGPLFDEARTRRFASRRSSWGTRRVNLDFVQVRHSLEDLRKVLSELSWNREVILIFHDPALSVQDAELTEETSGHFELILRELKKARPLARVLVWDYLPANVQAEARKKVEEILGKDRVLTGRDLQLDKEERVIPRSKWMKFASGFGLFF